MKRILLVDNDENFVDIARISLEEKTGAEVIIASGGNEAIHLLSKGNRFDLIISEYDMPQGTGLDLLKHQLSRNSSIPFFFFTHAIRIEIPYSSQGFVGVFGKNQFVQLCTSTNHILNKSTS